MTTTIELKEQMKALRQQEKEAKKEVAKIKKEYLYWKELMSKNGTFCYVNNWKDKFPSFEDMIRDTKWKNNRFTKAEWDFLYTELGYTDTDFFTAFMGWDNGMFKLQIEDRKCSICMGWYGKTHIPKKFKNCDHFCCEVCYPQIRKTDGHRCCVICRESEKPK